MTSRSIRVMPVIDALFRHLLKALDDVGRHAGMNQYLTLVKKRHEEEAALRCASAWDAVLALRTHHHAE
eukprot:SAG11_NODE_101_length_16738_cov_8.254703_3_plen_69_part_00